MITGNRSTAILGLFSGQIVLGHYGNGLIFSIDIQPPGVVVNRIIGGQRTVCLVCQMPSAGILRHNVDHRLKGTGDIVNFLSSNKAAGIGLPIQHQRLAIDKELLCVAFVGSNCQGDGVTNFVGILLCGNRTVSHTSNVDFCRSTTVIQLECKGNFHMQTLVAGMNDCERIHLIICGNTGHSVGIHLGAVDRKGQLIAAGTLQLEVYTVAVKVRSQVVKVFPIAPTGHRAGRTILIKGICALIVDDTECVDISIVHLHTQDNCKADISVTIHTVCNRQIVLGFYGNRLVIAVKVHQPSVVIAGIVGIKNAVCMVSGIPSAVCRHNIEALFKATGNIVDVLIRHKCIGVAIPTQQQGFAVDIQLLAVASLGSYCKGDSFSQLIVLLICSNCTVCQLCNIDHRQRAGIPQFKGDLHFLTQVAVHSELDTDTGISNIAGFTGCELLGNIDGCNFLIIDIDQCIAAHSRNTEEDAFACNLGSLCVCQGIGVGPIVRQGGVIHDLHSVLAVAIGMVQTQTQGFTVGEGEVIDHREVLCISRCIPDKGADIIAIYDSIQPAGVACSMAIHLQSALVLVEQIPVVTFGKLAACKGAGNHVSVCLCLEGIGAVPVGGDLFTVDQQLGVVIAGIPLYSQGNAVTHLADFLICNDGAVLRFRDLYGHFLAGIGKLEGNHCGSVHVSIKVEGDSGGCFLNATGLAGSNHLRKVEYANFLAFQINIGICAQDLDPVLNAVAQSLCSFFLCQGICILPGGCYCAACHSLNAEFSVSVCMIQTNAELFPIGELKDISKGEILSVGICILNRDRNIIGLNHRIQPLTLRHTVSGYCTSILAGNIPRFCMYQEG